MKNAEKLLGDEQYNISSPFGWRIDPITQKRDFHNGVDYATYGKKIPCYAIESGIVQRVSKDKFGGLFAYIKFPQIDKVGLYYHLDKIIVNPGDKIAKAQKIAIVGTTGNSTGVHLHFSLIKDNPKALIYNQADYIDFETYTFKEEKITDYSLEEGKIKIEANNIEQTITCLHNQKLNKNAIYLSELEKLGYQLTFDEELQKLYIQTKETCQNVNLDGKMSSIYTLEQNGRSYLKTEELAKLGKKISYENSIITIK